MNRQERRYRTSRIQTRRQNLYNQIFGKDQTLYEYYYWWHWYHPSCESRINEEVRIAKNHGMLRDRFPGHNYDDYVLGGMITKKKIANLNFKEYLDELGIPNCLAVRGRKDDPSGC